MLKSKTTVVAVLVIATVFFAVSTGFKVAEKALENKTDQLMDEILSIPLNVKTDGQEKVNATNYVSVASTVKRGLPYGELSVTVINQDKKPAAGKEVFLINTTTGQMGNIILDEKGSFSVTTLGREKYILSIYADSGVLAEELTLNANGESIVVMTVDADFSLPIPEDGAVLGIPACGSYFENTPSIAF